MPIIGVYMFDVLVIFDMLLALTGAIKVATVTLNKLSLFYRQAIGLIDHSSAPWRVVETMLVQDVSNKVYGEG